MKRIFIAIDISEDVRRIADRHVTGLRKDFPGVRVSWVRSERMHLTMAFLGEIDDEKLSRVNALVDELARGIPSFLLELAGPGVFPNKRRPGILWLGIRDEGEKLKHLKATLDKQMEKVGFQERMRKFQPHLTIARLKEPAGSRELAMRHLETEIEPVTFAVPGITVYESRLGPKGPTYIKNFVAGFS